MKVKVTLMTFDVKLSCNKEIKSNIHMLSKITDIRMSSTVSVKVKAIPGLNLLISGKLGNTCSQVP